MTIYDLLGQQVYAADYIDGRDIAIDMQPYADGMYVLRYRSGNITFVRSFVKVE